MIFVSSFNEPILSGPVDNSDLYQDKRNSILKRNLDHRHYKIISSDAAMLLYEWYGGLRKEIKSKVYVNKALGDLSCNIYSPLMFTVVYMRERKVFSIPISFAEWDIPMGSVCMYVCDMFNVLDQAQQCYLCTVRGDTRDICWNTRIHLHKDMRQRYHELDVRHAHIVLFHRLGGYE